jgi:hypothetical protein
MTRPLPACLLLSALLTGCEAPAPSWPSDARVQVATSDPDTPRGLQRVFLRWPHAEGKNVRGYRVVLDEDRELAWSEEPSLAFDVEDRVAHEVTVVARNLDHKETPPLRARVPAAVPAPPPGDAPFELISARVLAGDAPGAAGAVDAIDAGLKRCVAARPPTRAANLGLRLMITDGRVLKVALDPPEPPEAGLLGCVAGRLKRAGVPSKGRAVVALDFALRPAQR